MKSFTKISFIVAGISMGLGVLGIGNGLAMGADLSDLSEMGIYISPYHQVAVSKVVTEVKEEMDTVGGNSFEEHFYVYEDKGLEHKNSEHENKLTEHNHSPKEENIYHSYSTVAEDIKRLEVDVQNAEIYIFSTEEEKIRFDSNREKEIGRVEGNTLKLEEETFSKEPLVLEIYIPVDLLREIEIKAAGGSLNADRLVTDKVSIEMDAGKVEVGQLIANKEAEIWTNAGNIIVGFFEGTKLELDCDMGSIMVVCEGNETDYNYNLECDVGSIQIGTSNYSGIGKEMKVQNHSNKVIDAECDMGKIMLEFPNSL